jgi:hypothetical protein
MMTTRIIEKPAASSTRTSIAIAAFFCLFVLAPPAPAATTDHSSCDLGDYRPSVRIRHIRAGRRRRAIAWSERFVVFVTTRATVQGRAGFGLRRDALAFPGERRGFTRLNDEGSDRLRRIAASICPQQTGFSSLRRFRSGIMPPYTYYPPRTSDQVINHAQY